MSPFCMYQLTHFVLKATHLIFVQLESFQQWFVGLLQEIRWLVSTTDVLRMSAESKGYDFFVLERTSK